MDLKCWHRIFNTALCTCISFVSSPTINVRSELDGSSKASFKESSTEGPVLQGKRLIYKIAYLMYYIAAQSNKIIMVYIFTWMNFCDHRYVSNTGSCKASKHFVNRRKWSFSWTHNGLSMALPPHVTFAGLLSNGSAIFLQTNF